jgi:hypothetical protein
MQGLTLKREVTGSTTRMRYTVKTDVRKLLVGCPDETPVEVEAGIPVIAKAVPELRAFSVWPPGNWVLDVRLDPTIDLA